MPTDFGVSTKNSFLALAEDTEGDKKAPPQAERKKVDKRDKPARGGAARGGGAGRGGGGGGGGAPPAKKTDRRKGPGGPPKTEKRHGAGSHNWGDPQQDVNFPSQTEPATPLGFEGEVGADGKTADGKTADGKEKEIEGIGLDEFRLKQEAARPKGDAKSERKPDNSNRDLKAASAFVAAKDEPLFDIEATEVKSKAPAKGKKAAAVTHDPAPKTKRTAKLSVSDFWKKNPAPEAERHERQERSFERQDRFEQQSFDQPADGSAPAGEDRFQNQGSRDGAPQGDNRGRGRGGRGRGGRGRGGRGRGGPRDGGDGGDFRSGGEFRSGGDYRGGRGGGEFRPRGRGGEFRPRGRGGEFRPRDGGEFRPRDGGEFRPRDGSRGGPRGGPRGGGAPRGGPRGSGGPRGGGRGRGRQHDGEGGGFADEDNFPKLA